MTTTASPNPWPVAERHPLRPMTTTASLNPWPVAERRVAVLIPSRNRPIHLARAIGSVLETSTVADIICYIDEDQSAMYGGLTGGDRLIVHHGPRIGPAPSANALVAAYPGYAAYGLITDDSTMVTPAWDQWVLSALDAFPKRLCVVSPRHNLGEHVDMPFVSKEWVELVGWYACPDMVHYSWPIYTGLIGELTAIVHAPDSGFRVQHEGLDHTNQEVRDHDARVFFEHVSLELPAIVHRIRKAMHP